MGADTQTKLEQRVIRAAETALARQQFVTAVDVLVGIGWLSQPQVDEWRQGRVDYLERSVTANLSKISMAMKIFRQWARRHGLLPSETAYLARTRDHHQLRFSKSGDSAIEVSYRTHWVSPQLSEAKRDRLAERQSRPPDIVAMWAINEWTCTQCGGGGELHLMEDSGPMCLACADLDHLVFLVAGDAALTRRAKKASRLSAVVVRLSRARRRYERQGLLVEEEALAQAEQECLADEEIRLRRRLRAAERRGDEDEAFQAAFTREISRLFPGCPPTRAEAIAHHATERSSGRVGRTAAARNLDSEAVTLAVVAAVRHGDTDYDRLLMSGNRVRRRVTRSVTMCSGSWKPGGSRGKCVYIERFRSARPEWFFVALTVKGKRTWSSK